MLGNCYAMNMLSDIKIFPLALYCIFPPNLRSGPFESIDLRSMKIFWPKNKKSPKGAKAIRKQCPDNYSLHQRYNHNNVVK